MSLTPIDQAFETLLGSLTSIDESESLPLIACNGRVLAKDLGSPVNVPPLTNSAMDGYAMRTADLADEQTVLKVTQRIAAGQIGSSLAAGEAARIFTGAPIPEGADAVVVQENCEAENDSVRVLTPGGQ